jgi:hypothetical protein
MSDGKGIFLERWRGQIFLQLAWEVYFIRLKASISMSCAKTCSWHSAHMEMTFGSIGWRSVKEAWSAM